MEGKVSDAAKTCSRCIRKRVWFTFDIFMARDRPGLELEVLGVEGETTSGKKNRK